jgi:hypothetical protein
MGCTGSTDAHTPAKDDKTNITIVMNQPAPQQMMPVPVMMPG